MVIVGNICVVLSAAAAIPNDEIDSLLQSTQAAEISVDGDVVASDTLDIDADDVKLSMSATGEVEHGKHSNKKDVDCTGRDVHLWLGGHKEQATNDNLHLWVRQNSSQFSSGTHVWYANTRGKSCKEWCLRKGYGQCVRGMDDAHHQSGFANNDFDVDKCTLFPAGHNRKRTDEAGCRQRWQTQVCACSEEKDLSANNPSCPSGHQELESDILYRACDVINANPNDPYDTTRKADLLFRGDPSNTEVSVNVDGNYLISSDCEDEDSSPITAEIVLEDLPAGGHELVFPDTFKFFILPKLQDAQSFIYEDSSGNEITITSTPSQPIEFASPPSFRVCGDEVELQISASPNIVSNCLEDFTKIKENHKCRYQNEFRLWRRTDQSLKSCYELCASTPECKFFSYDGTSSQWKNYCMGCTELNVAQRHDEFHYYEVCKRSDVRGQCEQHEEHSCRQKLLPDPTVENAWECAEKCKNDENCKLFAYDGNTKTCQKCPDHHNFKGRGPGSSWAVMGRDCTEEEIKAKFG